MERHKNYMEQCLRLAKIALAAGDPPVGALIVFEGKIIGQGIESGRTTGDVTNHAEIVAIRDAINNGHINDLHLSSMYTTHEPCIMCSYMIRHHHIPEIVYGASVSHVGGFTSQFTVLTTEDVPKWGNKPKVINGVCLDECDLLNEQFLKSLKK